MRESRVRLIGRGIVIGLCALACFVALSLHAERVAAANFIVSTTNDTGGGSLRDAITQVNAGSGTGDTITFSVTGTITLTSGTLPALAKPVAITGPTSGAGMTVDGNHAVRVFVVNSGVTASISTLTIANGNALNADGSGIYNQGTLTVTNSTFSGNTAGLLGVSGGGIYNVGTLTVTNSTFSGNSAIGGGGGIYNAGTLTVTNSTLSRNSANGAGGGIYNFMSGTLTVKNSTFSRNSTNNGFGGGVNNQGTLMVTNSTLSGNSAGTGGGIFNQGTLTVTNTIIAGNTAPSSPDILGAVVSHGHNLLSITSGTTGITGGMNGDIVNPTPLLSALGSYGGPTQTVALLPGSPAIDAGDDTVCATTGPTGVNNKDQRGITRPVGAHCDIGAFESQGFTLSKASGDGQAKTVGTAFNPLVVTVTANVAAEPVNGGVVTFTGPATGAGIVTSPVTATIAGGQASITPTANTTVGSYGVAASAASAASVTFSLTNTALLTSIAFTGPNGAPLPTTLKVGQMVQITATGTFSDGSTQNLTGQVQWSSSNPQVATVDANGNVTGKSPGTATITATLNGVTKTITVTIGAPTPIGITVQPAPASRPSGAAITSPEVPPPAPKPTGR